MDQNRWNDNICSYLDRFTPNSHAHHSPLRRILHFQIRLIANTMINEIQSNHRSARIHKRHARHTHTEYDRCRGRTSAGGNRAENGRCTSLVRSACVRCHHTVSMCMCMQAPPYRAYGSHAYFARLILLFPDVAHNLCATLLRRLLNVHTCGKMRSAISPPQSRPNPLLETQYLSRRHRAIVDDRPFLKQHSTISKSTQYGGIP